MNSTSYKKLGTNPFIAIGSKGTSLPRDLKKLTPPLQIGANGIAVNGINWSRGRYEQLGKSADGWVSEAKKDDPFFVFPLNQALAEAQVFHVAQITWNHKGQHFTGEGFFPANWRFGEQQPLYVAVRALGWDHGCVERESNAGNCGQWVAALDLIQSSLRAPDMSDSVDIEKEIEQGQPTYAHESETTKQAIIKARRGQGPFRQAVKTLWHYQCAVTECKATAILQASHIKPWREGSNLERLDHFNGLLLTPNLHTAFDCGFISFQGDGQILFSKRLASIDAQALGLRSDMRLRQVFPANKAYLVHHRRLHGFQI